MITVRRKGAWGVIGSDSPSYRGSGHVIMTDKPALVQLLLDNAPVSQGPLSHFDKSMHSLSSFTHSMYIFCMVYTSQVIYTHVYKHYLEEIKNVL